MICHRQRSDRVREADPDCGVEGPYSGNALYIAAEEPRQKYKDCSPILQRL